MLILVWCWLFVFLSWINSWEAETRMWMLSFHSISWNVGLNIEICYPWVMSIHVNFLLISRNTELVKWMSLVSGCPLWKIRIKTTIILTLEANLFVLCLRKGSVSGVKLHGLYFCFKTQVYNAKDWLVVYCVLWNAMLCHLCLWCSVCYAWRVGWLKRFVCTIPMQQAGPNMYINTRLI